MVRSRAPFYFLSGIYNTDITVPHNNTCVLHYICMAEKRNKRAIIITTTFYYYPSTFYSCFLLPVFVFSKPMQKSIFSILNPRSLARPYLNSKKKTQGNGVTLECQFLSCFLIISIRQYFNRSEKRGCGQVYCFSYCAFLLFTVIIRYSNMA